MYIYTCKATASLVRAWWSQIEAVTAPQLQSLHVPRDHSSLLSDLARRSYTVNHRSNY